MEALLGMLGSTSCGARIDVGAASRRARARWRHQLGNIASAPQAQPNASVPRTRNTIEPRHWPPKKPFSVTSCRLFNANANSAKNATARTSQTRIRIDLP